MKKNPNGISAGRRRLLAALGIGGVATALLPRRWIEPALQSVVLPAHAATSYGGHGTFSTITHVVDATPILDFLVPQAYATGGGFFVCVNASNFQGDIYVGTDGGAYYHGPSSGPIAIPFSNTKIPLVGGSGPGFVTVSGEVKEINGQFAIVGTVLYNSSLINYTAPYTTGGCGIT